MSSLHSYVHFELYADQPEETQAFYEDLFGWTFQQLPDMEYTTATPPGPPDGGLMDRGRMESEIPPTLAYLRVDDLETARSRIGDAGGTVLHEEIEVPGVGRFSVFQAPGNVVQALWEIGPDAGGMERRVQADDPPEGSIVRVEMRSSDPDATRAFFESAFDFSFQEAGPDDWTFERPQPPNGGLATADGASPVPATVTFILVDDLDATLAEVQDAGGKLLEGPEAVEDRGERAIVSVPGGIPQGLWQPIG